MRWLLVRSAQDRSSLYATISTGGTGSEVSGFSNVSVCSFSVMDMATMIFIGSNGAKTL